MEKSKPQRMTNCLTPFQRNCHDHKNAHAEKIVLKFKLSILSYKHGKKFFKRTFTGCKKCGKAFKYQCGGSPTKISRIEYSVTHKMMRNVSTIAK